MLIIQETQKDMTLEELRENYLVEDIFKDDQIELVYSHVDRIIFGGIKPVYKELELEAGKEMGVDYFLKEEN